MNKQLDNATTLWAFDVLRRFEPAPIESQPAPRHYPSPIESEDYHVACFKRQCERDANLRRLMVLPGVTAKNDTDDCACGNEATCTDYRNGHEIGLCDDCY